MSYGCRECLCRNGYDAYNQERKPCEHWLRWTCHKGNPCINCTSSHYEIVRECEKYKLSSERIEPCLMAVNQVYDDGYRFCPLVDCIGCERCMEEFEKRIADD